MAPARNGTLELHLAAIDAALAPFAATRSRGQVVGRFCADLAAARFHLRRPANLPPIVVILGGTGTGKSTLLNRLLGVDVHHEIAATSFRRTYTAGPIAVASEEGRIPTGWLGIQHRTIPPDQLPARGMIDALAIVISTNDITASSTLVDTPDLDGDQPAHHAQADRVFRWADAVVFVVTPEKYQMTELLPYYRLARRYGVPALYVMNKAAEQAVIDDYAKQVGADTVYALPRDDAGFEPAAESSLGSLRSALGSIQLTNEPTGRFVRVGDLMQRLRDQIVEPARADRREVDQLIASLHAMETPPPGVDVNPISQQLQRRLQQRSVLYLMGPGRVLDRVRQVPGILARLPRTTWDLLRTGKVTNFGDDNGNGPNPGDLPSFRMALAEQFVVVQSRIDDVLRSSQASRAWIDSAQAGYTQSKLDPSQAGIIADDEINKLQQWMEKQWNATPRDTAMIERLLKVLPGGKQLSKWSEAAPYLLAIVVATHHAFFGHIDLMILGGWTVATWLTEKLSNQVAARARAANRAIGARFTELAHQQIERTCAWLESQAPTTSQIEKLAGIADRVSESLDESRVQNAGR